MIPADFPIPTTSHVRSVFETAESVGLEFDKLTGRYFVDGDFSNGANVRFKKGDYYVSVTFDRRGYIVQAGGRSPDANSWVISVDNSRRFKCTPKRALEVLTTFTMPQYAEAVA